MAFTHLHLHTEYSLLDGSCKISEVLERAKSLGMDALAITDHGVMYGVVDFYKEAKRVGIKPILGCEVYVSPGSRFDREKNAGDDRYYHLILLAENQTGYANLVKLVSKGFTEGFYYRPRVDFSLLQEYHEGIIALSACLAGEIPRLIMRNKYEEARACACKYRDVFGVDNFFLELQEHGIPEQKQVNQALLKMSRETGIGLVATNDVHYLYESDAKAHDILLCIQTGKKVNDTDRMRYEDRQFYMRSESEMEVLFPYAKEALENTSKIAARCHVELEFGVTKLPVYPVPDGFRAEVYLEKLCTEGLHRNYALITKDLEERLSYELDVIKNMGYVDYFLIVWDYINYARKQGIAVGPGRGSAAGSLVSYCLGITDIDPIKYQLIFERFLNPDRISMPDIDVDFAYERRQEIIDYVVKKYGSDRVCQIITFGTLQAKGVIRDVGRVLDMPYAKCDKIAKLVPRDLGMTLELALAQSKELRQMYESDLDTRYLIDMSKRLEGLPRHSSIHAAGVVISKKSVDAYVPVALGSDGGVTTQFTMTTLEELGLLKMDFLGLRTLSVIQNCIDQVKRNYGISLDVKTLDYDDKNVYTFISTGKTDGVFQLESSGMQNFMKELKPENLEDIIAGISLYRPGPMDFIPKYIKGKNTKDTIIYDCVQLEPILSPTYGCIVYQEQVMQIVRDLAGYTMGRSDLLRRAMSKKKGSVMEKERANFVYGNEKEGVAGCVSIGIDEKIANKIFDEMTDFAKYAFNKSHAACYAFISYQTAYLKYYYPKEFMAATLTSVMDNTAKLYAYIGSLRQMGIHLLSPDINVGESTFSVDGDGIRFGLSAIKGVGSGVANAIVEERRIGSTFKSLEDFITRLTGKEINKRTMESFIKAGALDSLEGNRRQKLLGAMTLLTRRNETKSAFEGQMSLFDIASEEEKESFRLKLVDCEEFEREELLANEKDLLGIYISGHPLEAYEKEIQKRATARSTDFLVDEEIGRARISDGKRVILGGMLSGVNTKITRKGQSMAFATLEDLYGGVEIIIFPQSYEKYHTLIEVESKVFIEGRAKVDDEDGSVKLVVEKIVGFGTWERELWIQYANKATYDEEIGNLLVILGMHEGKDIVGIYLKEERAKKYLGDNWRVDIEAVKPQLESSLGSQNVKVMERL